MTPEIQPLYLNNCATPTASPSHTARAGFGRSRNRWPWPIASSQNKRNDASVRAIREKRDMRARKCGEGRGRPPCSRPECPASQPGRRRDRQGPGHDRDQNRREVADAEHQVRDSPTRNGKPGRSVGDDCRIEIRQSAAVRRPRGPQARRSLHQSESARAGPATRDGSRPRPTSGR